MKQWIQNHWQASLVALVVIGVFFVYAWFPYTSSQNNLYTCDPELIAAAQAEHGAESVALTKLYCEVYGDPAGLYKFNSPDETLNYFWSLRFANGESLFLEEPLEDVANNLIRPRSVNMINTHIVPGSFLGIIFIHGSIAKILSLINITPSLSLIYITPLFAALGLLYFYRLVKLVFDRNIALISLFLASIMPAWMYFTSRSMFHNVLFVSLFIIGIYYFAYSLQKDSLNTLPGHRWKKLFHYSLSGFFIGQSLVTRTSEIGWILLLVLLLIGLNYKRIFWPGLVLFFVYGAISLIPLFVTNLELYGAPLSIGYSTGVAGDVTNIVKQPGLLFSLLISPFGIDLRSIAVNGFHYLLEFFWYITIPSFVGAALWLIIHVKAIINKSLSKESRVQLSYLVLVAIVSAYLLLFYGSWQIIDRIDMQTISIGTSYVRYWIPIYLGIIPFFAYMLSYIVSFIKRAWPRPWLIALVLMLVAIPAIDMVYWKSDESLSSVNDAVQQSKAKVLKARTFIAEDDIVVLGYKQADKIFFPEHVRIISELAVAKDYEAVALLADTQTLYYYHFADPEIATIISEKKFEPFGLRIQTESGYNVFERDWIYPLVLQTEVVIE